MHRSGNANPLRGVRGQFASRCLLVLLLTVSCAEAPIGKVRAQIERGKLDSASALLDGYEGSQVENLRAEIEEARELRADLLTQLEDLRAQSESGDLNQIAGRLGQLRLDEKDPVVRERIDIELSRVTDLMAERGVGRGKTLVVERQRDRYKAAEEERAERERAGKSRDPLLTTLLAEVRALADKQQWAKVEQELAGMRRDLPQAGFELDVLTGQLLLEQEQDLELSLSEASEVAQAGQLSQALASLVEQRVRFSANGCLSRLEERIGEYEGALGAELQASGNAPIRIPEGSSATELARLATEAESGGQLAQAIAFWEAAEQTELLPAEADNREDWAACVQRTEWRLDLRRRLQRAFALDPDLFQSAQVEAIAASGVHAAGSFHTWEQLPLERLQLLLELSRLLRPCSLGLAAEKLTRGSEELTTEALAELGQAVEAGRIGAEQVWPFIAQARGDSLPEGGYQFDGGQWRDALQLSRARVGEQVKALGSSLREAPLDERAAALAPLLLLAQSELAALEELRSCAEWRLEAAGQVLHEGDTLVELRELAQVRRTLDELRTKALALIFDEHRYFYPFLSPDCTVEKARGYPQVQREVSGMVEALEGVWRRAHTVDLPPAFRLAAGELRWWSGLRRDNPGLQDSPAGVEGIPGWAEGLPLEFEEMGLAEFAWDAEEAGRLRYNRRVSAHNEELWKRASSRALSSNERAQVRITNAYREMFGRAALAWDARLQEASRWHADYMAEKGSVGHTEVGRAGRVTHHDRMHSAGYAEAHTENCLDGNGSPSAAHNVWLKSSGHHRNLLDAKARGMASSQAGSYWTQNFGKDRSFEEELNSWQY